jgi:protein O-GlcNAc transferase
MLPLAENHDRKRFRIYYYSDVRRPDALTARLQSHADGWRNIRGISDAKVAEVIRQDQIDVLVDLTKHMADNRLLVFARKPAPIQVTWLAYPGTTGLDVMDYRLTDRFPRPSRRGRRERMELRAARSLLREVDPPAG